MLVCLGGVPRCAGGEQCDDERSDPINTAAAESSG